MFNIDCLPGWVNLDSPFLSGGSHGNGTFCFEMGVEWGCLNMFINTRAKGRAGVPSFQRQPKVSRKENP